jgi:hypothetical protein
MSCVLKSMAGDGGIIPTFAARVQLTASSLSDLTDRHEKDGF